MGECYIQTFLWYDAAFLTSKENELKAAFF